jgi:hypothetical protein
MSRTTIYKAAAAILIVVGPIVYARCFAKRSKLGDSCLGSGDCTLRNAACVFQADPSGNRYIDGTGQCTSTCESDADCGNGWSCASLDTKSMYRGQDAPTGRLCVAKPARGGARSVQGARNSASQRSIIPSDLAPDFPLSTA